MAFDLATAKPIGSGGFDLSTAQPVAQPGPGESTVRGLANGATFNLMPMIAAAGDATIPLDTGASKAKTWAQRYQENLAAQNAQDQAARASNPVPTMIGNIGGGLLNPLTRALPVAKTVLGAVGQGAGIGASYGAGTALSNQDSLPQAAKDIGVGAVVGGAIPGVVAGAAPVARGVGRLASDTLGLSTGAGGNAIRGAYNAGRAGGDAADTFSANMSGEADPMAVVDQTKAGLSQLRADRGTAYRSGMVDVSKDQSVLSFDPIDKAMGETSSVKLFKGQDLSKSTAAVRSDIQGAIDNWKSLDPAEYHTPEGFDALKQQIGDIKDNLPFGSPQRAVADRAYNAVRTTIADQAPAYAKVMKGYSDASDEIDNIQRELSLNPKANPSTALRKLQSVMRDNVNTSYGQRADLAAQIDKNGTILPALAGQSLRSFMPRGLSGAAAVIGAGDVAREALSGNPRALLGLATAPVMSPRLVGNVAYGLGAGARLGGKLLPTISGRALTAPSVSALVPAMLPRLPN